MEDILSQITVGGLELKLTSEKLFINCRGSSETFALRSMNGVGVIDFLDKYNNDMLMSKAKRSSGMTYMVLGAILLVVGVWIDYAILTGVFGVFGILCFISGYLMRQAKDPELMSAVRIMLNSGNRDFTYHKESETGKLVSEFIVKIEDTLTAYNKKN